MGGLSSPQHIWFRDVTTLFCNYTLTEKYELHNMHIWNCIILPKIVKYRNMLMFHNMWKFKNLFSIWLLCDKKKQYDSLIKLKFEGYYILNFTFIFVPKFLWTGFLKRKWWCLVRHCTNTIWYTFLQFCFLPFFTLILVSLQAL